MEASVRRRHMRAKRGPTRSLLETPHRSGRGRTPFDPFDLAYPWAMSTLAREAITVLPPADLRAMSDISRFLQQVSAPTALLGPDGQSVPVPAEALQVLMAVVASMQAGKAITIASRNQQLTTQEAANLLGISRPTLVKLLDKGEISYRRLTAGGHRRVQLEDVLDYQRRNRAGRQVTLDELTAQAAEAGLYDAAPDYTEALREARRHRAT